MSGRTRIALGATAAVLVAAVVAGIGYWRGWFFDPTVDDARRVDLPSSSVEELATGLKLPWGLTFLPDGTALITERDTKKILSIRPDGQVTEVDRIDEAVPGGEGGLLGIVASPSYDQDRLIYVYYTTAEDNRIARLRLGETPQPIVTGIAKAGNHNGGRLAFGPDGLLYATAGDAGDPSRSQDRNDLAGKILRMTPDGQPAPGNPFGASLVYSMGHRNPQGIAWDSGGQLFAAEFGQNRYDELNRIEAGGNYGWPEVEGVGNDSRYINPIATWTTAEASPSGIAIIDDKVWVACLRGERLYRLNRDGTGAEALLQGQYGRLRTVAPAPDGSVWVMTSNRARGNPERDDILLRLTP